MIDKFNVAGEGIVIPTGRDIDVKYLDANEEDIKKQFKKLKLDWPTHGVTIMCDSWTGPTGMSLINFMVYCNGIMFFHKSVDATGHSQDADFIFAEINKVVTELGPQHIVQIITDNGSNYKKTCKILNRKYSIVWQPCVAHTINLMLKTIGEFMEHKAMIEGARRICRWLYNHSKLHAMMKAAIGGELVRWNTTRFGTNYMFLESMLRCKDKFMAWVASRPFLDSCFSNTTEGRYAHSCLSSLSWWDNMSYIVKSVEPLYAFLRFADQDKVSNLSEVLLRYNMARNEYESLFHNDSREFDRYMGVIDPRMGDIANESYVNAAAGLHPRTHYAYDTSHNVLNDLRVAFESMADTETCVAALQEAETYRRKYGSFFTELAEKMAYDHNTSPAQWWAMFGGDTPNLQKLALRLVSQCWSSSGCEGNWSTFALIHTKVRNRLLHQKLHKLVYVNYNLRIRMREAGLYKPPDDDPFHRLMELSLYDDTNLIRDWMENGRSNANPLLDEEDTESDALIPSRIVVDVDDSRELQRITGTSSLAEWADQHVGDTHIGKRKLQTLPRKKKAKKQKKRAKERSVRSDESTGSDDDRHSPSYQESGDSSSPSASDGDAGAEGGTSAPPSTTLHFTGETDFTHATQDQDHGAPHSQRTTVMEGGSGRGRQHHHGIYFSPHESDTSFSAASESSHGYHQYTLPDPSTQPSPTWVYEWQEPEFYNMLHSQWRTTAEWTGQTWNEFKAELLATRGIALMSSEEYNIAYYTWN